MFHGVLDERLHEERQHRKRAQLIGYIDPRGQSLFEALPLDGEVRLHQIELLAKRDQLARRPAQNGSQEVRQPVAACLTRDRAPS